jgi:hypothetical protein
MKNPFLKATYFLFIVIIVNCSNSNIDKYSKHTWPKDDTFDLMLYLSGKEILYKKFDDPKTYKFNCDTILVKSKMEDLLNWQNELVKNGKRDYAFSKGVCLAFSKNISYEYLTTFIDIICPYYTRFNHFPTIEIGDSHLTVRPRFRNSKLWKTRPIIRIKEDSINILSLNHNLSFSNSLDSLVDLSPILKDNRDPCYSTLEINFSKQHGDYSLIRVQAKSSFKVSKLLECIKRLKNYEGHELCFYDLNDTSINFDYFDDSACVQNSRPKIFRGY